MKITIEEKQNPPKKRAITFLTGSLHSWSGAGEIRLFFAKFSTRFNPTSSNQPTRARPI